MSDKPSTPPFSISEEMRFKMSFKTLMALLTITAISALAWGTTRWEVAAAQAEIAVQAKRIDSQDQALRLITDTVIRVDERTAEMKRQMDRSPR